MCAGDVVLKMILGTYWTLKNVKFILALKRMLISVGYLDKESNHVIFGDHKQKMKKVNLIVTKVEKHGILNMVEVYENDASGGEGVQTSTLCH